MIAPHTRLYARDNIIDLDTVTRFFKGGGTPAMPAPAAPPPAATSTEVQLQRRDTLKAQAKKKGMQSTLLSGGTDDASGQPAQSGKNTLLGGGA